jgi:hypothetical protein
MATSQFRVFTNNDVGAPQLNGLSGSLINVLTWCLVTGSGWLQPSGSISYLNSNVANLGIFQQPSGSGCILYVNDASPHATALGQEAWVTGWENVSTMSVPCGTGSGQFPRPEQLLGSGHYVVRKSSAATTAKRDWIMYVDPYTFYFFNLSLDSVGVYTSLFFGDYYSLNYKIDPKPCFISARAIENTAAVTSQDANDQISLPQYGGIGGVNVGCGGVTVRTSGMLRNPTWIYKLGDWGKASVGYNSQNYYPMLGIIPPINLVDNNMYICPLSVWQGSTVGGMIRGRFRGMYHMCHPIANFTDGQIISGSGNFTGKVFQIVKTGTNGGFWTIEISNTLETN